MCRAGSTERKSPTNVFADNTTKHKKAGRVVEVESYDENQISRKGKQEM